MTKVNRKKCIGCGACAAVCPEGFEVVKGKARVKAEADCVDEAIKACPVGAITK